MKFLHYALGALLLFLVFAFASLALFGAVTGGARWTTWLDLLAAHRIEVVIGCVGILFLTILYVMSGLNFPERVRYLAYDLEGGGTVSISLKAMQDFLARLRDEFAQIVALKPELKASNGAVDIQMDVSVRAGSQIPELCRMLQDRARECIKQNVGIADIREVRVRVQEIIPPPAPPPASPETKAV